MNSISSIISKITALNEEHAKNLADMKRQLEDLTEPLLEDSGVLRDALTKLENSTDYELAHDGLCAHNYLNYKDIMPKVFAEEEDLFIEILKGYLLNKNNYYYDSNTQTVTVFFGPVIVVNHDGSVYDQDSGKMIITRSNYSSTEERNQLIESWMEKQGYYPGVYTYDKHGNVFPIDTRLEKV